jgi:hypothetical protein
MYLTEGYFFRGEPVVLLKKSLCRNEHEQSVRTQTMKIAQNEIFFVGSKD